MDRPKMAEDDPGLLQDRSTYFASPSVSFPRQDYMQNVHGKEIDLLRTTVKVPGKRPPRAVATVAPTASPKTNGLTKDRSALQLGLGTTGECPTPTSTPGYLPGVFVVEVSSAAMVLQCGHT